jgi:hypothetical protein
VVIEVVVTGVVEVVVVGNLVVSLVVVVSLVDRVVDFSVVG